ncbi:MAG TPA: hypothetical protein DD618_03330 [Acholeplasmatales bacterium]|nr:hypothetical protein [Acholeplasmatales bacterium]
MRKKEIIKIIRTSVVSMVPDQKPLFDINKIDFENLPVSLPSPRARYFSGLALKAVLTALVILLSTAFLYVSWKNAPVDQVDPALEGKEQIYSFSAVSATNLLYAFLSETGNLPIMQPMAQKPLDSNSLLVMDSLDSLNKYLNTIEDLIGKRDAMAFESLESDRQEYQVQLVLSTMDLLGTPIQYIMYYNETIQDSQTNVFSGILLFKGTEFSLEGSQITTDEETKMELIAYSSAHNKTDFVKVEHKTENDQQTFEYEFVLDDETVQSSELKIETEDEDLKIELSMEEGDYSCAFEIRRVSEDGEDFMKVDYDIQTTDLDEQGEIRVTVVFDEISQTSVYHYFVSSEDKDEEYEQDRIEKDDDEDEDEADDNEIES